MKNLPIYLLFTLLTLASLSTPTAAANEVTPNAITASITTETASDQGQTSLTDEVNPKEKTNLSNKEKRKMRKENRRAKRGGGGAISDGVFISGGALLLLIILLVVLL